MEIIVISPDQGDFKLAMLYPDSTNYFKTHEIVAGGPAEHLRQQIKDFYRNLYGVEPLATSKFYNDNQQEVAEDSDEIHSVSYIITVPTLISRPSVDTVMVMKTGTTSQIEVVLPKDK